MPRRLVPQLDDAVVGVFIGLGIVGVRRMNADEVAANAGNQDTFRGHRPRVKVGLQEVGIFFEVLRRGLLAALRAKAAAQIRAAMCAANVEGE